MEAYPNPTAGKQYGDSSKIWSIYVSEAEKYDQSLVQRWKVDMEGILIFAGLFSATVTGFIIESYKNLKPDATDTMVALLTLIAQERGAISNGTVFPSPSDIPFQPSSSAVVVNAVWFLSLTFSLACALAATLVQQWARNYLEVIERRSAPNKRARVRVYLFVGIETFRIRALVKTVPTLLHVALLLFLVGLVIFLFPIHLGIACMLLAILGVGSVLYVVFTLLPVFYRHCPYQTPLSSTFWHLFRWIGVLRYVNRWGHYERIDGNMVEGRILLALADTPGRRERDLIALRWTLDCLTDDDELEPFVAGIPGLIQEGDVVQEQLRDGDTVLDILLRESLLHRLVSLFHTCRPEGHLDAVRRIRRAATCMKAIQAIASCATSQTWSLLGMSMAQFAITLSALKDGDSTAISTLAISTEAIVSVKLLENLSNHIAAGPSEEVAITRSDEEAINDTSAQLSIATLERVGQASQSRTSHMSAGDLEHAAQILRQERVLKAVVAYTKRLEQLHQAQASLATQSHLLAELNVLTSFGSTNYGVINASLGWIWSTPQITLNDVQATVDKILASNTIEEVIPQIGTIALLLKRLKTMKLRNEFLHDGRLRVIVTFVEQLLNRGVVSNEEIGIILHTIKVLTDLQSPLTMRSVDPALQLEFVRVLEQAVADGLGQEAAPTLSGKIIEALLSIACNIDDRVALGAAESVVSNFVNMNLPGRYFAEGVLAAFGEKSARFGSAGGESRLDPGNIPLTTD